jgi:4,5-DOPA dioxygenase extradiol
MSDRNPSPKRLDAVSRRALLGGALACSVAGHSAAAEAQAQPAALFVSHGSPLFLPGNEARRAELSAWGARLSKPKGIVVMTPHFASKNCVVGSTGRGFAWYDLPTPMKRLLPQDLEYPSPASESLARQLDALLGEPVRRDTTRRGLDHTTWMPLLCLFPRADLPVLEVGFPYVPTADAFALGAKLAPLRDQGVLFIASGGMTHNLAMAFDEGPVPAFAREFDGWAAETITHGDVDALLDWRRSAPAANLAHPDDGGHFRVALTALGIALGRGGALRASSPVVGFEGTLSKRCLELG